MLHPHELPTIDLDAFASGSAGVRAGLAAEVRDACDHLGFFLARSAAANAPLAERLRTLTDAFFDLPDEEKDRSAGLHGIGYLPRPDREETTLSTVSPSESFIAHVEDFRNHWPPAPAAFKATVMEWLTAMDDAGAQLVRLLALASGRPVDAFDEHIERTMSFVRMNRYLPVGPAVAGDYRAEPHCDYNTVTIIKAADEPNGLEAQRRDGEWVELYTSPDTVVVLLGNEIAKWTDGRFPPTEHSVVNPPPDRAHLSRQSITHFHNPSTMHDDVLEYLESRGQYVQYCLDSYEKGALASRSWST